MKIVYFFFWAIIIFIIMSLIGIIVAKIQEKKAHALDCGAIGTFECVHESDPYNHF